MARTQAATGHAGVLAEKRPGEGEAGLRRQTQSVLGHQLYPLVHTLLTLKYSINKEMNWN